MRLIDANAIKYTEYRGGGGRDYPENIVTEYEIDRMPTVDAVILPCKIGDTVFVLWRLADPDFCSKCPDFCWGGMGDSHECGKTEDGWRSPECIEIQEWTADLNLILGWIRYDEFNKTVFRTREEAEAALAKMDK